MMSGIDNYTREAELNIFVHQSMSLRNALIYLNFPINSTCCTFPEDYPALDPGVPEFFEIRASSTMTY